MTTLGSQAVDALSVAHYSILISEHAGQTVIAFENDTVLGFILEYSTVGGLLVRWQADADTVLRDFQFPLRRAADKSWNLYLVFLTADVADDLQVLALGAIEEDLRGARKIARAGLDSSSETIAALLPLLPMQAPPKLEAVDIVEEIRQRATEVPIRSLEAYFSRGDEPAVIQVFEETQ